MPMGKQTERKIATAHIPFEDTTLTTWERPLGTISGSFSNSRKANVQAQTFQIWVFERYLNGDTNKPSALVLILTRPVSVNPDLEGPILWLRLQNVFPKAYSKLVAKPRSVFSDFQWRISPFIVYSWDSKAVESVLKLVTFVISSSLGYIYFVCSARWTVSAVCASAITQTFWRP